MARERGLTDRALATKGLIKIRIKERGPTPRKMRGAHNRASKKTWRESGKFHHGRHIPKRFTEAGGRELGFRERTQQYNQRKQNRFGHQMPNVWSGVSRQRARRTNITSTAKRVRNRYNVPALNFHSGRIELRRANKAEAKAVAVHHAKTYEQKLLEETT